MDRAKLGFINNREEMNNHQTSLLLHAHQDLVTDLAYDYYGNRLATCSLDQRIKIWRLDEQNGTWVFEDEWKAHEAPVVKLSWAHPEFGSVLASCSFDRTVKVWEERRHEPRTATSSRWACRALLTDARGSVRSVEFGPPHFGLKLASISTDMHLRVYECLQIHNLSSWTSVEELDLSLTPASGPQSQGTPTLTAATLEGPATSSSAPGSGAQGRLGGGSREADGGWCLSWCKEKWWGEVLAVACGTTGTLKILELMTSQRPHCHLNLQHTPSSTRGNTQTQQYAITSVSWAPSCGRSYHLIATGSRDGYVRIWKLKPPKSGSTQSANAEDYKWTGHLVADFNDHQSSVGRVEWNVTGTILSSAGDDGKIRLYKLAFSNIWKCIGAFTTEH
ncbi:hypothetical protein FRC03_003218, partial [Tulasnella sp. 419]